MARILILSAAVVVVSAALYSWFAPGQSAGHGPAGAAAVSEADLVIPDLTGDALIGSRVFAAKCAECHGANGLGTDQGPPFLHRFYLPGHHGDGAFFAAAHNGVQAHHWKFGDMPPVEGITDAEIKAVVAYVRGLQSANGLLH